MYQNIYSLFRSQTAKYGDKHVFFTRGDKGWQSQTWDEFEEKVHDFACALLAKGLTKGASVAILAGNIPEWTICDIATIATGGVGVGIYPTSSAEQCEYVIDHSDAEFVVVDTVAQLEKLESLELPKVREIFLMESGENAISADRISSFADALAFGNARRREFLPIVNEIGGNADADDIAIMVYTSGTTGKPKGAMLSHKYILNSVVSLRRSVPVFENDVAISYLPGCHVAERISGIYNRLYNGTPTYFIDDLSRLYEFMLEIKPTVFASLPRFFEKIHAGLMSRKGTAGVCDEDVKNAFGGHVRLLTSGGAPLPTEIAEFYRSHGLPILQAFGLTENICVAFNTVNEHKFGTVGRPMPMCSVRIASDGEILVKSEMMFSGYYKEPEKTAEMFDAAGWLKTGDLGELDDDGFLKITGRKKEIIVLSSGKNVAPALVENYVKESHLISHCFLYGDGHSYCVALVTLNEAEVDAYTPDVSETERGERILSVVSEIVAKANARISSSEQIKKYKILERDFSAAADEITPTMKLKRNVVAGNYRDILEKLYDQS